MWRKLRDDHAVPVVSSWIDQGWAPIVEARADDRKIYLRTGCFCNPGVNETVFGYSVDDFASFYNDSPSNEQLTLERFQRHLGGRPIGAIRASFGYANAPGDVDRIVEFMKDMITRKDLPV